MNSKETLSKVFKKYNRMKKIVANPISPKLTQSFQAVIVQGGIRENTVEKMIINKADAEGYIYLIDRAIAQLPNTEELPYQDIIKYKYYDIYRYTSVRISIMIGYSVDAYFKKLKRAQEELMEIIDLWGIDL